MISWSEQAAALWACGLATGVDVTNPASATTKVNDFMIKRVIWGPENESDEINQTSTVIIITSYIDLIHSQKPTIIIIFSFDNAQATSTTWG